MEYYLQRLAYRPRVEDLPEDEQPYALEHFDVYANEVLVHGREVVNWRHVEAVEVAAAPTPGGAMGWLLGHFLRPDVKRYHVGIYHGSQETVLPNISLSLAAYVLQMVAYYAPGRVAYYGPINLDLCPLEL